MLLFKWFVNSHDSSHLEVEDMWRNPWLWVVIFLAIFAPAALIGIIELCIHVLFALGNAAGQIGHSIPTTVPTQGR